MKLTIYKLLVKVFLILTIINFIDNVSTTDKLEKITLSVMKNGLNFESNLLKKKKSSHKKNSETSKRNRKSKLKISNTNNSTSNSSNTTSNSLLKSMYHALNQTFVVKDLYNFKNNNRKYDFKILDKELEEIFHLMLLRDEKRLTTNGIRDFIHFFMNSYNQCDEDKDNILNLAEFIKCMKTDKYLVQIISNDPRLSFNNSLLFKQYSSPDKFYELIFESLDDKLAGFLNFNDYMTLRLMAFSWRKCSIFSPFLEESDFECALEIVAGYKTLQRTLVRKIFFLALDLSNSLGNRAVDFLSFINIAGSIKLYSKINGKQDEDITRNEFNVALDTNSIPLRYNQAIINELFDLMQENDKPNQGIDLQSFIFYDYFLKIFFRNSKRRAFFINRNEFYNILQSPLFPNRTLTEIFLIPQYEFTADSYQMYQYYNISQFNHEENYLYKSFIEMREKITSFSQEKKSNMRTNEQNKGSLKNTKIQMNTKINNKYNNGYNSEKLLGKNQWSDFDIELFTSKVSSDLNLPGFKDGRNNFNITIDLNKTVDKIFNALDIDFDDYINFKEFSFFLHVIHVFTKEDKYRKGKISAGTLYEIYQNYADFPVVSYKVRENANRFTFFDLNTLVDPLDVYLILNIENIAKYFYRMGDTQTLNEIEAKKFMSKMNMRFIPDVYLNKCLRGVDYNNLPKYEWECCFIQGMSLNLKFYETMDNYLTAKLNNITLSNTVFYNIDPRYAN